MKKIFERARYACEHWRPWTGCELEDLKALADAVKERIQLEQTPITEEWLKTHGWYISQLNPLNYARMIIGTDMLEYSLDRHELTIFRNYEPESGVYADALIDNVGSVAKLYDACELCGIELTTTREQ